MQLEIDLVGAGILMVHRIQDMDKLRVNFNNKANKVCDPQSGLIADITRHSNNYYVTWDPYCQKGFTTSEV